MFSSFGTAAAVYQKNEFSGQLNDFHISNGIRVKVYRVSHRRRRRRGIGEKRSGKSLGRRERRGGTYYYIPCAWGVVREGK